MEYKTIGIIGGMGPLATVDLFQKIVLLTDAKTDQEHVPILIDNNTQIYDRTGFLLKGGTSPLGGLILSATRLQKMGADFLVLACNTAHYFYDELSSAVRIPIINMIEETAAEVANQGYKKVGLLGTQGFMDRVDYERYYDKLGIELLRPTDTEQEAVTALIYQGIKAENYDIDASSFLGLLERQRHDGAEAFVLACTELPIAFSLLQLDYPVVDPAIVVAKKAIIRAGGRVGEPAKQGPSITV